MEIEGAVSQGGWRVRGLEPGGLRVRGLEQGEWIEGPGTGGVE